MAKKTKTYTPAPEVPSELQARYQAVLEVLSGQTTVAAAARRLGMSRNHFQTLMHRSLEGMIERLTPGKAGRPAKPEKQAELEEELEKLRRRTLQLEQRVAMTDKLMELASTVLHGPKTRARSARPKATMTSADEKTEEEPGTIRALARQLDALGLPRAVVARTLRLPESTLRRHATRAPRERRPRSAPTPHEAVHAAQADVRALRGLVGADALRRAHPALSRRRAASIKAQTVTAMERERRASSARVVVGAPGIIRGFDAMDLGRLANPRYVLVACDAAVPYRTMLAAAGRYDAAHVARVLAEDFERHGAPYVLRMDRAAVHGAPQVRDVLAAHGVLVLHGPPRYPRFYGQLERQNREHAAWLAAVDGDAEEALQARLERMRHALNTRWRRRSLGWQTAAEAWRTRTRPHLDRRELRASVEAHVRNLRSSEGAGKMSIDTATRLAIEHSLTRIGYLRIETREGDART
jgi:hypothetical protein